MLASNPDIFTLADLKGKTIVASTPDSLWGFQAQARAMLGANLSIYTDPAGYIFTSDLTYVVNAVLDGTVDAGFVTTLYMDSALAWGKLDTSNLRPQS